MGTYSNIRRGYAEDLSDGNYYASGWERDFARFLEFLMDFDVIEGWEYEPYQFSFQGLGYNRGPFVYRPDFVLRFTHKKVEGLGPIFDECYQPGKLSYVEVKGRETGKDRNKWRRFRKHIGEPLAIVKREQMIYIQDHYSPLIPNWESHVY